MKITTFKFLIFGMLILSMISCDKFCNEECFTPPGELRLKVTDKADSTDLIYTGLYNVDSIAIFYFDNDVKKFIEMDVITDSANHKSMIASNEISWKSVEGFKDFYLYLDYQDTDTLYLDVVTVNEDCCTFHNFNYFGINGTETEWDTMDSMFDFKK
jgi:hypothetical protein